MTKIRSRDSAMIQDRRRSGGSTSSGGSGGLGGLDDILGGALGGRGGAPSTTGGGGGALLKGGGLIGILVVVATILLPQLLGGGAGQTFGSGGGAAPSEQSTGGDDDTCSSEAEQILCGATVDVQQYWSEQYPASFDGLPYPQTQTVFFSGFTNTGCGQASAQTGPFYCPADNLVYFDLDFLAQLQSRFGASGGPLSQMYIAAHEYGHHIQYLTGQMDAADRSGSGPESDSVRLELQADCYAGMWVGAATTTEDPDTGVAYLEPITDAQLADAMSAAEAVGDDHIQASAGIGVNQDTWTHGASDQRQRWFNTGHEKGTPSACDTFSANNL